ncbi:MAG: DNA mismatch repair endonuclease MutL [Candidatus Peregrinibacteria bacterium]
MSLIKVLPENLVNQIAAGEVVERPASVVKELVENSIDAGADRIVVELKDGGKKYVSVSDNGCGMAREDVQMALQRHATSKISAEADLWKIGTMGFRGEALASIASVSKLVIRSKRGSDEVGTEVGCDGGHLVDMKDAGMSDGTVVEVYSLFYNTPARGKYLKSESIELGHVSAVMNSIALANPGIAFKLAHNGKVVFELAKVTDLISRIGDVFGKATAEGFVPIFYGGSDFKIDGYVGKPALSRSTTKHQYIFVNGRSISHYIIAGTIKSAFHSMLMEGKKPVFVMNIQIDPALVDVNVHPRKIEVRFEDQQSVIRTVYSCVKSALEKENLIPKGWTESRRYMSDKKWDGEGGKSLPGQAFEGKQPVNVQDAMNFTREFGGLREEKEVVEMKSITQISNSYIVAENDEGLVLIDQHAAHERARYEQLMDQFESKKKTVQPLLVAQEIEWTVEEAGVVKENMETFIGLGFEMEHFSGNKYVVNGVPSFLSDEDIDVVVKGVLDDLVEGKLGKKFQGRTEEIIHYMACRSAVKFGQRLSMEEAQVLVNQLLKLKRPYTCPHGRPTMVSLTLDELEKMFGRK